MIVFFTLLPLIVFTITTSQFPIFSIRSFVVLTGSMEPALPIGSIIFTQPTSSYNIGDIISFKKSDAVVTHRIYKIVNQNNQIFYQTYGDANQTIDTGLVASEDILGRNIFRATNAGKLILYLKTLPGFLMLIVLPTLIFIGSEVLNIKKELEKEIRKKVVQELSRA